MPSWVNRPTLHTQHHHQARMSKSKPPAFDAEAQRPHHKPPYSSSHSSLGDLVEKHQSRLQYTIVATARLCLLSLVIVTSLLFYFRYPFRPSPHMQQQTVAQAASVSNAIAGWHDRLQPYPGGTASFHPKRKDLAFVQFRSTPVQSEGFTAALFAPNVVVDARGTVSTLSKEDWQGLVDVAKRAVSDTPQTGEFRNQWRIKHERTSFPIDWLRVATASEGDDLKEVSVYGFDGIHEELEKPVGEITALPMELKEVFNLVGEARDGYKRGNEDLVIVQRVKSILPPAGSAA
ncbi:hypothetical protein FRC00_000552 [Tulasnella sp. 408]|nr:hypothetical protein FRC00_000552 [Tulasnella sp. 408]